jgi:hypothetical protein
MRKKIGILGTRGIPNNYGGFEKFAEYLSFGLQNKNYEVIVYNSHFHPYKKKEINGVNIVHRWDPKKIGLASQFIYDLLCVINARKQKFNVIIQLGYTTSSIWAWLLPKKAKIIYNMDGIEWKREKYKGLLKKFLKYAEKLAIKTSDIVIADSMPIKKYLDKKYNTNVEFVAYPTSLSLDLDISLLKKYNLNKYSYNLIIARFQPDNSIEKIIKGHILSTSSFQLIIVGDYNNKYGRYLTKKYIDKSIIFLGKIYNKNILDSLRHFSFLYFHGHTSGGTNPSMLEAMATSCIICAHNNEFNRSVLNDDAFYFNNEKDISEMLNTRFDRNDKSNWIENNLSKLRVQYSEEVIIGKYYNLIS